MIRDITKLAKDFYFQADDLIARLKHPKNLVEHKLSCSHKWSIQSVLEKVIFFFFFVFFIS